MADKTTTPEPVRAPVERDYSDSFNDWVQLHSRAVTIGIIAAAAIALGYGLYWSSAKKKEARAQQALVEAERPLAAGNVPLAQADLEKLVSRYDGTHAAVQGSVMLAEILFDQNKYPDGIERLRKVQDDRAAKLDAGAIHNLIATGYESLGKPADAAKEYHEAAAAARFPGDKAEYQASEARTLEAAGKKDEAAKIWADLAADPAGTMADEAKLRLGELTAKPAKS